MTKNEQKQILCERHQNLLYLLLRYGNGAMPLPMLRELCLALGLYPNAQSVNRAVRDLKHGDVLTRQTWVDGNADLILARKYAIRYFTGASSQGAATPPRHSTMASYVQQARKVAWLLALIDAQQLRSVDAVDTYLRRHACTMFRRASELLDYYAYYAPVLSREAPDAYRAQLTALTYAPAQRGHKTPPQGCTVPADTATIERMHRRGIYVIAINTKQRAVAVAIFPPRGTRHDSLTDWIIDAYFWLASLLPYYRMAVSIYALDANHKDALKSALSAHVEGSTTSYWQDGLIANRLAGLVVAGINDSDFVRRWCGGVHRIDL